jgi:DNA-binding Lrp family transcriptional regulator
MAQLQPSLTSLERRLLESFQRGFPLEARPYAAIGEALGASEEEVLAALRSLAQRRVLARVGAVLAPRRVGESTLAALAVPAERLEEVAALVSRQPGVNHNYEREHRYNLWFVVTGADAAAVQATLRVIEAATGLTPLVLPLEEAYHLDLGFPLQWS